jgi:sn-glycerol 3-phosphate transport system substrate-binding protein
MWRRSVVLGAVLVCALAACGGGSAKSGSGSGTSSEKCPLAALTSAKKPVEITYWHAMTRASQDELQKLTDAFNKRQSEIHVTLSGAASYPDNLTRFKAGLGTGQLPDLFQGEETTLQTMIDSNGVLPIQTCIDADHATTADLVPRVKAYFTVRDVLWPMPFNDSNPILYYNRAAFQKAGLDPDKPPKTLAEVKADSEQIVKSGATPYGIALKSDSWLFEHWIAKSGNTLVNNGNGRQARATSVTFDQQAGTDLFAWMNDMVKSKLALSTGTADIDHYLAVANQRAAMTIDTSAALGTISQILSSGQFRAVKLGTGPMPGPDSAEGGVLVGGGANYIVNKSSPEKQAAAYEFAKYLVEPQVQAEWAAATGYVPVSTKAATLPPLTTKWAQQPGYKIAYEQLLQGPINDATAGPVIGPYGAAGQGVRGAIIDGMQRMLTENVPPATALKNAANQANAAIADYNARVG